MEIMEICFRRTKTKLILLRRRRRGPSVNTPIVVLIWINFWICPGKFMQYFTRSAVVFSVCVDCFAIYRILTHQDWNHLIYIFPLLHVYKSAHYSSKTLKILEMNKCVD